MVMEKLQDSPAKKRKEPAIVTRKTACPGALRFSRQLDGRTQGGRAASDVMGRDMLLRND
ncbi:hypothetical protein A9K71_22310 [Mesorhizobium sp. WSM3873]|nr:hypothetical protein A9K71_22310 [Mesorhizobium sp. WSM3873]